MVDTITESFCERCGTRYEFTAPTRLNPLRKTRGIIGGLKNYLTSQDALSDAMGDAMRTEEDQLAAAQLEAFHESFNFCIDCRQYTCVNCWNDDAGRCRSCAPIPGTDDLAERLAASLTGVPVTEAVATEAVVEPLDERELQRRLGMDAWPSSDLPAQAAANGQGVAGWPDADGMELVAAEAALAAEPEPADAEPEAEPEPVLAVAEAGDEPEPVAEVEPEPEPVVAEVEPEPEPVVAEVEPEPEPTPPLRIAPISETILRFPTSPASPVEPADDEVAAAADSPELAARRAQLDLLGLGDPGQGPVTPERPAMLPYRSRGAALTASARQGAGFWEASAREVAGATGHVGVQNCGQCGLSLSASARFCRRCGTRQARSA